MSGTSSPHAWRPDEVRRKQFTVRMRGLDPNEVRGFLNALADNVTRLQEEISTLKRERTGKGDDLEQAQDELMQARSELQQVKDELQRAQQDQVTDQAIQLLNQAQELADALIDEGMQSARDLMNAARTHHREVVPTDSDADNAGVRLAAAADHNGQPDPALSAEIDDVRTFARVAQVQFRTVLDALNEQVNRLNSVSDFEEQAPSVNQLTPAWAAAQPAITGAE